MIRVRIGEVSVEVDPIPAAIAACMIIGAITALRYLRRTERTPSGRPEIGEPLGGRVSRSGHAEDRDLPRTAGEAPSEGL